MPAAIARRRLIGACVVAVATLLVGCGDDDDPIGGGTVPLFGGTVPQDGPALDLSPDQPDGLRTVVMIGDSITLASTPLLEAQASELGIDLTVHAEVGRRITVGRSPASGIVVLEQVIADEDPDLLIIALGTNDVGKYDSVEEYAVPINELLAVIPEDQPLVWINTYLEDSPDLSAMFNAALIEALQQRGNATIGRWSNVAQRDGALSDGVHPSDDGAVEFTDLVVDEIENWIG